MVDVKQQEKNRLEVLNYVDSLDVSEHDEDEDVMPAESTIEAKPTKSKKKKSVAKKKSCGC